MKKQLLGSTALVAAGMLAAAGSADAQQPVPGKITLQLGGYMNQFVGVSFQNLRGGTDSLGAPVYPAGTGARGGAFDVQSDAEIYFTGKTTLDNGMVVGVNIEQEIVGSPGATTDEQWAFVEGSWGQVRLGWEDPPVFLMHYGAPDAGLGLSYGYHNQWVNPPGAFGGPGRATANVSVVGKGAVFGYDSVINTTRIRMEDDDSEKVVYYTPRIEGFQLGVSYTPEAKQDATPATPAMPTESEFYTEGWSLGLNFVRKFNPVDVALSAGYITWANNPKSVERLQGTDAETPWGWNTGINLGYAGFKLGASYAEIKDLRYSQISNNVMSGGVSWEVGLQYDWAANSVSIGYFQGWIDGAVGNAATYATGPTPTDGHDENRKLQISAGHRFGPGVAVKGSAFMAQWEDEGETGFDNNGFGIVGGLYLNF